MIGFEPFHIHFVAKLTLKTPSFTASDLNEWLIRLVDRVGMSILGGPFVFQCDDPGNEGITGGVFLKESHSNIHIWDKKIIPYLQMDLYSCKLFASRPVLDMLEEFDPRQCHYQLIDRNGSPFTVIEDATIDF